MTTETTTKPRRAVYFDETFQTPEGFYYATVACEEGGHIPQDDLMRGNRLFATIDEVREYVDQANMLAFGISARQATMIVEASMLDRKIDETEYAAAKLHLINLEPESGL